MPIYAYRCTACGFQNDYLQKLSDPLLTDCPECGKSTLAKQVTAAGFQLKGTGWYATDFKNNGKGKASTSTSTKDESKGGSDSAGGSADSGSKPDVSACGAGACPACT
jgi:putative FmdB family regulatory protein